jgi:predicted nucleic acid-binding Zn ribbon protein
MRRSYTQGLKEVIDAYLKEMGLEDKIKEITAINSWEEIIGKTIANRTKDIYIKKKKLYIHMNSAVARNELIMIRDGILKAFNEKAGEKIVDEIVIK